MKNQTRINKLLTALLVLCVLFVCMAGTAMAAEDCAHVFADGQCTACGVTGGYCGAEPDEGDEEGDEGGAESVWWTLTDSNSVLTIGGEGAMADYAIPLDRPWHDSCSGITSLSIEEGVTRIGENAFVLFEGIESVTIPASVQSLGYCAFADCAALKTVTFAQGSELTTIDSFAFQNCDALTQISLPAGVESFHPTDTFFGCSSLTDIHVAEGNATYKSVDGVLYTADGTTLVLYPAGKTAESFTTPAGVTTIGQEAFSKQSHIESIILSKGVTTIGDCAFQSCRSLNEVTIPVGVTSIGDCAFQSCSALNKVTIPASVTSIGTDAFYDCDSLATVNVPCNWDGTLYSFADTVKVKITTRMDDSIDNGDGTHDVVCTSCGYVHVENEPHTYNQYGICVCKAVKTYTVTLYAGGVKIVEINGEAKEISDGETFTVPHGKELTVKFENTISTQETGVKVGAGTDDDSDLIPSYEDPDNILTIPASVVNQDFYIGANAYVRVQFNLHGGTLTKDGEREFNRFGGAWDAETATLKVYYSRLLGLEPEYFQLDGHTLAGAMVDGSDVVETGALEITGEKPVDILWNCTDTTTLTHVEAKAATCMEAGNIAHYTCTCGKLYAEDKTAVLTADQVKIPVDENAHSMDTATGECEHCGEDMAVATVTTGGETTYYQTLQEAMAAADGHTATVKLLADCSFDTAIELYDGSNVTLNLSGKTITAGARIFVSKGATLTIEGEGNYTSMKDWVDVIYVDGTLNISGGTFSAVGDNVVLLQVWDDGQVNISGGSFTTTGSQSTPVSISCNVTVTGTPTFSGLEERGEFSIVNDGTLDLSGTTPTGWRVRNFPATGGVEVGRNLILPASGYALKLGDQFVTNLSDNGIIGTIVEHKTHNYTTEDYDATHHWTACACGATTEKVNHTFTYTPVTGKEVHIVGCSGCTYTAPEEIPHEFTNGVCVCTAKAVAKVEAGGTATCYTALETALGAAQSGSKVTLLASVELTSEVTIPSYVTFNGGEFTLSGEKLLNNGTITGGTFTATVINWTGDITGGTFDTISYALGAVSGQISFKTLDINSFSPDIDLRQAVNIVGARVGIITNDLPVSDLKLPDGYALEVAGKIVSTLPSAKTGTIVAHEHGYTYTDQGDGTHSGACPCGAITAAEPHIFAQNNAGEWMCVCGVKAVASITSGSTVTEYANFANAVAAWTDATTLTLLADVTYDDYIDFYGGSYTFVGGNYTLDLGDAAISIYSELTDESGTLYKGELTIESGTIKTTEVVPLQVHSNASAKINSDYTKLKGSSYQIAVQESERLTITGKGCDGWRIMGALSKTVPITIPGGFHLEDKKGNPLDANDTLPAGITIIRADHNHNWSYTADDEKDTITATCSGTIGTCPSAEQSITLNAPDAVYSGNPVEAEVTPDGADLTYTLRYTGTDYASADAPINAGDYTVTMTVGDKSVSASFTISPKDISIVQSIQFSLAQTSFVYSGEAPALNVTGVDSSVGNYTMQENTDYTVGTVQVNAGSHKLTVTGMGNYTGSVELDYEITRAPIDAAVITAEDQVYTGEALEPAFTVTLDGKTLKHNVDFTYNWTNNVNVGEGKIVINGIGNYEGQAEGTFAIAMADAALSVQTDKDFYTYGETITVTASRAAKPATFALRSAIAPDQMALFLGDTQLGEAVDAVDGIYTMTVNTADKELSIGENTLRVVYVSDGNLKDAEAPVTVLLLPKELTIISAGAADRVYEKGNKLVAVTGVDLDGIVGIGDDVKADLTGVQGTLPSDNAGTYTTMALPRLILTGSDKEFYTISDATVNTNVEITPKEITSPSIVLDASSFVYDGTEKKPAVTSVKDGDDLIDATEYTVSYANNIEMGTATVTLTDVAGGNYAVSGSTIFQITQSGTEMTATADKTSYTYGETITVTGTVKATGTAPATTLTLRSAPAAQQVALFAADGTQLTDPMNVVDGAYTLTYNTTDKGILPAASITLTVKFVGDDNMADQSASVTVTLTAKSIEPVLSGSASKAYDGTDTVTDAGNLTINLNGIIAGDTVSASAAGYAYADETVGQSKTVTANGIALSGADSIFYTLAQTEASANIGEIKKAMLIGLTEPADTTLDVYCADADAVIGNLPDTVVYHLPDGKTVDLKVEWSCTAYDNTPGAANTFAWAVSDSEKLTCYEIAQNVADDGTVIVTNSEFLPVTVTGTDTAITYNGTAYDVTQMFAIDSNAGAAVFEIIGGGTGEGTLNGSVLTITKAGTINIKVTTAPNAAYAAGEATAVLTISKGTPAVTLPTDLTAWYGQKLSDIVLPTVDGGAWSWTDTNSTVGDAGVQTHQAIFTPADTNLWNITTHPVNITVAQAGTSFGEMKVYNGDTESATFTYGETITVKAEATAVRPAVFSLRSLLAPAKHQMALFIRNADGSEVQISEAVNEKNGVYTMTYNTAGKALKIGNNALIARFVGDENMADYQETVLVTLNPKELGIASLTAQDRVYEPGNRQVAITGTEVSGKADANDDVSVLTDGMTATISSENVGTYDTALIPQDVSLTGNHAGYYFARGNVSVSIPQGVEITQSTPYTASGAPAKPVFDPIYQDGQTLGDIPVSLPAGTFNVPGNIEWEAPGDTPVTEGTPFTWVFTPDDPNWKPVTGSVVIYPDGEPPVITAPAGDQEVTVYEGEQGTMVITAADATSYQWYINRYDGLGYVPISGATSARYTTSVVNLDNDGFTYYCVASNAYGNAESPVFLLQVLEKIEVPETGDESNIALWTALAILSFAGLTIITMNGRRSKITR